MMMVLVMDCIWMALHIEIKPYDMIINRTRLKNPRLCFCGYKDLTGSFSMNFSATLEAYWFRLY